MLRYGLVVIGLTWLFTAELAWACEQCLGVGGANGPTIRALVFSMASLLFIIGSVGTGIGVFFLNLRRRSRMLESSQWTVSEDGSLTGSVTTPKREG